MESPQSDCLDIEKVTVGLDLRKIHDVRKSNRMITFENVIFVRMSCLKRGTASEHGDLHHSSSAENVGKI
jgi:hypothetical protein